MAPALFGEPYKAVVRNASQSSRTMYWALWQLRTLTARESLGCSPNSVGLEACKQQYYETDELPNPRPTQPKKDSIKSVFWATFSLSKWFFLGLGLIVCRNRLQETQPNPTFAPWFCESWEATFGTVVLHTSTNRIITGLFWKKKKTFVREGRSRRKIQKKWQNACGEGRKKKREKKEQ